MLYHQWSYFLVLCLGFLYKPSPPLPSSAERVLSGINTLTVADVSSAVQNIFVRGDCANIDNVKSIGNTRGIGYFEGGTANIGMTDGLIIATGPISNAHGPNVSEGRTGQLFDNKEDSDLKSLATNTLFDNVGIEFDFVPQKAYVSFKYVFASEEYCEFVGSIFNDVFGFFVSGPGINGPFSDGAINVALVPESNDFVSINNINHIFNSDFYVKNEREDDANQCNVAFAPKFLQEIEYDGFTLVLTAVFEVIPCETYHIRLVVGDVGDDKLDSAVFLESKSFDIGPEVSIDFLTDNFDDAITEGCTDGRVIFRRTDDVRIDEDIPVEYFYTINTTAEESVDFSAIPKNIVIPAFTQSVVIPVTAFVDDLPEGEEEVGIEIDVACNCRKADNTLFTIRDPFSISYDLDTVLACYDQDIVLLPNINNGSPPFEYQWEDGNFLSGLELEAVNVPKDYAFTVTDKCGASLSSTIHLEIINQGTANISGTYSWCAGQTTEVPIFLEGVPPFAFTYQIDGRNINVEDVMESPFIIPIDRPGKLLITAFSDDVCEGQFFGSAEVLVDGPSANPVLTPLLCPGETNASIQLNVDSKLPYRVEWDPFVNNPENPGELGAGLYTYTIIDQTGCRVTDSIRIEEPTIAEAIGNNCSSFQLEENIFVPNAFSPNNDGRNDEFEIFANPNLIAEVKFFRIFDRWGNLMFEARDFKPGDRSKGWDGRHKDKLMAPGVFIYTIELESIQGEIEVLSGNLSLLR